MQPTLIKPVSQLCTQQQCEEPVYTFWSLALGLTPSAIHRKQWEFVYIVQVLDQAGLIKPGTHGIGFGVGQEPLPKFFASRGMNILATDLPNGDQSTWARSGQWGGNLEWPPGVDFAMVDMNAIPEFLSKGQFDFAWSACSLDHLGTLEQGLNFIRATLNCVRPGGLVVHTTEFNLTSNEKTLDNGPIVFYREKDLAKFHVEMIEQGHEMTLNLTRGTGLWDGRPHDGAILHLCVYLGGHTATSVGLVIRKGAVNGHSY